MLLLGILEKAVKGFSSRNKRDQIKIIKQDVVKGYGVSSRANLLGPWVSISMTLLATGYHTKIVTLGCMDKRKGVSSSGILLISVKVLVGNAVITSHHARVVSLDYLLEEKEIRIKNKRHELGLEKITSRTCAAHLLQRHP
jgi:hypothetical protein